MRISNVNATFFTSVMHITNVKKKYTYMSQKVTCFNLVRMKRILKNLLGQILNIFIFMRTKYIF